MTHPDDRYPPPAPPGWTQRTEPRGHAPWPQPYGQAPRQEPYGRPPQEPYGRPPQGPYGSARQQSYGHHAPQDAPWVPDAFDDDRYGPVPRRQPHAHESRPHGADLAALRSAYQVLRRVSTLTALGSFAVYVVLPCCAPDLMGSRIAGELSLGMGLGILQLVVTFAAVLWYGRSARRSVDPLALAVRQRAVRPGQDAGVAG
ncbi:DUF485 domain-containing protein [Streptomyces sp. NBC_00557]|uniref:DUF485 domain-containing protein n=1 Tax=Streptomyces sp. NBC_00557 TaxID=2975776 RepID=UPI002E8042F9|nr:DUF485 domain-containing protein [Streptomyces sp. NBC_00557]WUC33691.1 DUF485 domain-containing protein [Streptomyces sp. NBC_00557]